ncbi:MAG: ATP-grasp domain-containing protein [Chloroflexota bacterium]
MDDDVPLILLLHNVEQDVTCGDPKDLIAIQDTANVALHLKDALESCGYQTIPIQVKNSLDDLKESLRPFSPRTAFVFNFCDGFGGNNLDATKVIQLIEKLGFRHTGSSTRTNTICIDKGKTKIRLMASGIPTPAYQIFTEPGGFYLHHYPAIVKPAWDDASIGIDLKSVIANQKELETRVEYILSTYHQPALVEEFISGRELSVSLWGNKHVKVLPITEMDYSSIANPLEHILSYDSKWVPESYYYQNIYARCPAILSRQDKWNVMKIAIQAYQKMGLRDFGRVDIRYHNQIPYIIDVNEIPDLAPGSGFPNAARQAGYDYPEMVEHILKLAMEREKWQQPQMILNSLHRHQQTVLPSWK